MNAPAKDLLVTLCGLVTSLLTAAILAMIQVKAHFALYAFTFFVVIPIGAIVSGGVASSGYLFGSQYLNHPLHRFFAVNIVGVAVATYFLLNYMVFRTLALPTGQHISEVLSFPTFLDLVMQNRKVNVLGVTTFSAPGFWGYMLTTIQILGFSVGGFYVYRNIASQLSCAACKRYLVTVASKTVYGGFDLQHEYGGVLDLLRQNKIAEALNLVSGLKVATASVNLLAVRHLRCPSCSREFYDLSIQTREGRRWQPEPAFQARGTLDVPGAPNAENMLGDARTTEASPLQIALSFSVLALALIGFVVVKMSHPEDSTRLMAQASQYLQGKEAPHDEARALTDMKKAAEMGNSLAMVGLGAMYAAGRGTSRDEQQAVAWYRKAAEAGNSKGMNLLGMMYEAGKGVPADNAQAAKWYERAAGTGNTDAMNQLGVLYLNGKGVPHDVKKAADLFDRASSKGNLPARHNLGVAAIQSTPPNYKAAAAAFEKAAESGYTRSMRAMAALYMQGNGVPRDLAKARQWITVAAKKRDPDAMFTLGMMDLIGQGGPRNQSEARQWFEEAAAAGNVPASKALSAMNGKNVKAR